jgi:hypothetical protein
VRKNISVEQGDQRLFDQIRYFFYLTNDREIPAPDVVFLANDRGNQENLIDQLQHGVGATRMPVDTLLSNWAYMVMAALAWTLKAWFALRLPETGRWARRYAAEKAASYAWRKHLRHPPRQDPSREVVDHSMEIDAGAVEQANDGGVDVPHLVSARRSKAHLWLCWMTAEAGAAPPVLPDEAVPGGGRDPDRAELLRSTARRILILTRSSARGASVPRRSAGQRRFAARWSRRHRPP